MAEGKEKVVPEYVYMRVFYKRPSSTSKLQGLYSLIF